MSSPLVLTYNIPLDPVLVNIFEDASGSPLPGTSTASLISLQSPNINLQNTTLTLQYYDNLVTPLAGEKASLLVENLTVIASTATNTIGTLSWVQQYKNPGSSTTTALVKTSSYVSAASGIFASYLFGNVISQYFVNGDRILSIYSAE